MFLRTLIIIVIVLVIVVVIIIVIVIVIVIIIISEPTLPPRDIKKVSDNGTCAILKWKPPYLSKSDNRSFPAKVGKWKI